MSRISVVCCIETIDLHDDSLSRRTHSYQSILDGAVRTWIHHYFYKSMCAHCALYNERVGMHYIHEPLPHFSCFSPMAIQTDIPRNITDNAIASLLQSFKLSLKSIILYALLHGG